VLDAGASGVAVISAILAAADPRAAALELRAVIDQALGVPTGEHA
jgi:thiamine monophosphate synthase